MSKKLVTSTKPCMVCGKTSTVRVDLAGWKAWRAGTPIDRALPELDADQREQLITGLHGACWDLFLGAPA